MIDDVAWFLISDRQNNLFQVYKKLIKTVCIKKENFN